MPQFCHLARMEIDWKTWRNLANFHTFLESLLDILVICECKVDHTFPYSHFHFKGFHLYRKDRDCFGGGVFIYVRRGLIVTRIHDFEGHEVESISLSVQTSRRAKKVLVISMHRPPGLLKALWKHEINSIRLRATVWGYNANWRPKLRPLPAWQGN